MLRLLLIVALSIPAPPQSVLSYVVTEEVNGKRLSGFYNVSLGIYSSYIIARESRDIGSEGKNSTRINNTYAILPGELRYPVVFFDPSAINNVTFSIYDRILNKRNGTREMENFNIQTGYIYIYGGRHNLTTIYISASRIVDNKTESLESSFRLITDLGITYYVSIEVIGPRSYKLHIKLFYSQPQEKSPFSYKAGIITILLGAIVIALFSLLIKLPIKIKNTESFSRWLAI